MLYEFYILGQHLHTVSNQSRFLGKTHLVQLHVCQQLDYPLFEALYVCGNSDRRPDSNGLDSFINN